MPHWNNYTAPPTYLSSEKKALRCQLCSTHYEAVRISAFTDVPHLESVQRRAAWWFCGSRCNSTSHMWSKSLDSCTNELKWSSLHTRRSDWFFPQQSFYSISRHFQFSSSITRTHPLTLLIPSSSINPYCSSFFINTPFLCPHFIAVKLNCISVCSLPFSFIVT